MKRVGVVRFPGTNCESETGRALGACLPDAVVEEVSHRATGLDGYDAVVLPGGFSYGDYLRCGAISRFAPVMTSVRAKAPQKFTTSAFTPGFDSTSSSAG